jgi:hypothetical protein
MLERLGIEVRDTPEGAVLIAIRPSRKHRPPTSDSAAPPGVRSAREPRGTDREPRADGDGLPAVPPELRPPRVGVT